MTKDEFKIWFIDHLDTMIDMGIMHYNSDKAKEIFAILKILNPEISDLKRRIEILESKA